MTAHKIVVIDDEPHIRHVISRKLQGAGYEVHTASDGTSGMELVNAIKPSLLITDYQMPGMNGLEVCTACRENEQTRTLPILVVTGSVMATAEALSGVISLGNVFCISKPFSLRELVKKVAEFVEEGSEREPTNEN